MTTTAATILTQLGGHRFVAMTGAKQLINRGNGLSFGLPTTRHYVKNGASHVFITLDPSDTYTVRFTKWNARKLEHVEIAAHSGVYCDMLRSIFTAETGLETRL